MTVHLCDTLCDAPWKIRAK